MKKLKVLITLLTNTPDLRPVKEYVQQVTDVSPAIEVSDASDLFTAEQKGDFSSKAKFDSMLAQADIIFGFWPVKDIVSRAPKLKWFQSILAGTDPHRYAEIFNSQVIVTNMSGIHGIPMREFVLAMMLMFAKQARRFLKQQQENKWEPFIPMLLNGKTLGIVGLGNIGKEVARLGKTFGMRVIANRRSTGRTTRARNVDMLMPGGQLTQLLAESDFVVLALPATPETLKIIGEKELRAMKPTAYLINIARGTLIDEDALLRALEEHWIAGAALDTVAREPLSPQSRLWELPDVIITPHVSGRSENNFKNATLLFCENLRRYIDGKKLLNIVDKNKGY